MEENNQENLTNAIFELNANMVDLVSLIRQSAASVTTANSTEFSKNLVQRLSQQQVGFTKGGKAVDTVGAEKELSKAQQAVAKAYEKKASNEKQAESLNRTQSRAQRSYVASLNKNNAFLALVGNTKGRANMARVADVLSKVPATAGTGNFLGKLSTGAIGGSVLGGPLAIIAGAALSKVGDVLKDTFSFSALTRDAAQGRRFSIGKGEAGGSLLREGLAYKSFEQNLKVMGITDEGKRSDLAARSLRLGLGYRQATQLAAVEQVYGVSGADRTIQSLYRRTGASKNSLADWFTQMQPILKNFEVSMQEVTDASNTLFDSFRGSNISSDFIQKVIGRWAGNVKGGEISYGELGDVYAGAQKLRGADMLSQVYFAKMGGFRGFKSGSLLGQANEVMGMKAGPLQSELIKSAAKGYMRTMGIGSWEQATGEQKYLLKTSLWRGQALEGLTQLPDADKLIGKFLSGKATKTEMDIINKLGVSDAESVSKGLARIEKPVTSILNLLVQKMLPTASAREQFRTNEERKQPINVIVNNTSTGAIDTDVKTDKFSTPGSGLI